MTQKLRCARFCVSVVSEAGSSRKVFCPVLQSPASRGVTLLIIPASFTSGKYAPEALCAPSSTKSPNSPRYRICSILLTAFLCDTSILPSRGRRKKKPYFIAVCFFAAGVRILPRLASAPAAGYHKEKTAHREESP